MARLHAEQRQPYFLSDDTLYHMRARLAHRPLIPRGRCDEPVLKRNFREGWEADYSGEDGQQEASGLHSSAIGGAYTRTHCRDDNAARHALIGVPSGSATSGSSSSNGIITKAR